MDFRAVHQSTLDIEDAAEAYVFDRLPPADLDEYEQHLLMCEECQEAVEATEKFIRLFRAAVSDAAH